MPEKLCDHTSVGMIVRRDGKLLLIERRKPPFGFAAPAGHVDRDTSFERAAIRELEEEVGLAAVQLDLIWEGRKDNPCRRAGGDWHYWKIFTVPGARGEVLASESETKRVGWYDRAAIDALCRRTEAVRAGVVSDEDWETNPGMEPIWYDFFHELNLGDYAS